MPPLLVLTVAWALGVHGVVLFFSYKAYDRALEDAAEAVAGQVRVVAGPDGGEVLFDLPQPARNIIAYDNIDDVFYSVSDARGTHVTGHRDLPGCPAAQDGDRTVFCNATIGRRPVRVAEFRPPPGHAAAGAIIRVAETEEKRKLLANEVLRFLLLPQAAFVACGAVLIWYGVGRGMLSVNRIRDAIARRTHQDLGPLEEEDLPAELHEQVHVINDLMQRLARTIDAQQRFIADATHQLRTPITVLRTQTQLAMRVDDPAQLRTEVVKLDASTARLVRLANQLLNLSRAEAGFGAAMEVARVDIVDLVEEVAAEMVPAALQRHTVLSVANDLPEAHVQGSRVFLKEMLMNLVDNAIRYTPPGGSIVVRARGDQGALAISVEDTGPGIPAEEREKVLERFYRSTGVPSDGSGLGLAIAREIAVLHGGSITLLDAGGGAGLHARVSLPRCPAAGQE